MSDTSAAPFLSIVCPAHDEQPNLERLVQEVASVLDPIAMEYEIIIVDDGSTDDTPKIIRHLLTEHKHLRGLRLKTAIRGNGHGQSAALHAGIHASKGTLIAMMDADLQNDPADLPAMVELLYRTNADMVQGDRTASRADTLVRKASSWVGRMTRRALLGDTIRDTGCSLRMMRRPVALALPLQFRGMHRFIPITARRAGFTVIETPVRHRPRVAGKTKYGIWNRALPGLVDCFAVRWMQNRRHVVQSMEIESLTIDD